MASPATTDAAGMDHHENQNPAASRLHRRPRLLSASAVALLCAATLAACGGSDDDDQTTATAASTTAQTTATAPSTATTNPDDTGSTPDDGGDAADLPDNGFSSQTANNVLAAATTSAQQAESVHVDGAIGDVVLDVQSVRGEGGVGTIAQGNDRFDIVAVGGNVYLKGSEDFYRELGGEGLVQLLGDRWLQAPADDPEFASLVQLADMERLLGEILEPSGTLTKGETTDVDGQPAIPLTGDAGTLYVAATGTPYPLRIVAPDEQGEVVFAAWDEPVELTAPSDAVDISQLETRGN